MALFRKSSRAQNRERKRAGHIGLAPSLENHHADASRCKRRVNRIRLVPKYSWLLEDWEFARARMEHNVSDEVGLQMAELDGWAIVVAHPHSLLVEGHNDAVSIRSNQLREIP